MGLVQSTSYEEAIDDLLRERSEKIISDGLRQLFSNFWNKEPSTVTSEIEVFCQWESALIQGKDDLTQSKLKNYVSNQLIVRLKKASEEEKPPLKDRCEVIFKFLKDTYKNKELTNPAISFINKGINRIRDEGKFPILDPNKNIKAGTATKYRALTNLLKGEVASGEKPTLKLTIAIFGIDVPQFDIFLENLKTESGPQSTNKKNELETQEQKTQPVVEQTEQNSIPIEPVPEEISIDRPVLKKSTFAQWLSAAKYRKTMILLLGLTLLSVTSFFGYEYLSKLRVKGEGLRPTIKASELFGRQFKLKADDFDIADSLLIMTDTVYTEDLLLGSDTVGLEKLIIKLRLINLYPDKTYFLDALYLKSDTWGTISGKVIDTGFSLNVDPNLEMMLDAEQTWPYEWIITSQSSDKGLPPLTEQHTVLEVSGKKNMEQVLVPFRLIFKLHEVSSPGNTLLINADKPYKIAFR